MLHYVSGVLDAIRPGSDGYTRWLSVRQPGEMVLSAIYDYQRISAPLRCGNTYEFVLELGYPMTVCQPEATPIAPWTVIVIDTRWPNPPGVVARTPFPRDPRNPNKLLVERTGPTCALIQTPFGHMVSGMGPLQAHMGTLPRPGQTFACDGAQRLELRAAQ